MFKATIVLQEAQRRILQSGLTFGHFEKPILFELRVEKSSTPLSLSLVIKANVAKRETELLVGKVVDNQLEVQFFMPLHVQMAWLDLPTGIIEVEGFLFEMMFAVEPLTGSDIFLLTYELYERRLQS